MGKLELVHKGPLSMAHIAHKRALSAPLRALSVLLIALWAWVRSYHAHRAHIAVLCHYGAPMVLISHSESDRIGSRWARREHVLRSRHTLSAVISRSLKKALTFAHMTLITWVQYERVKKNECITSAIWARFALLTCSSRPYRAQSDIWAP